LKGNASPTPEIKKIELLYPEGQFSRAMPSIFLLGSRQKTRAAGNCLRISKATLPVPVATSSTSRGESWIANLTAFFRQDESNPKLNKVFKKSYQRDMEENMDAIF
jgi:hypothetical protein